MKHPSSKKNQNLPEILPTSPLLQNFPRVWIQISPITQRQIAQQIAMIIQRLRQASGKSKEYSYEK